MDWSQVVRKQNLIAVLVAQQRPVSSSIEAVRYDGLLDFDRARDLQALHVVDDHLVIARA